MPNNIKVQFRILSPVQMFFYSSYFSQYISISRHPRKSVGELLNRFFADENNEKWAHLYRCGFEKLTSEKLSSLSKSVVRCSSDIFFFEIIFDICGQLDHFAWRFVCHSFFELALNNCVCKARVNSGCNSSTARYVVWMCKITRDSQYPVKRIWLLGSSPSILIKAPWYMYTRGASRRFANYRKSAHTPALIFFSSINNEFPFLCQSFTCVSFTRYRDWINSKLCFSLLLQTFCFI